MNKKRGKEMSKGLFRIKKSKFPMFLITSIVIPLLVLCIGLVMSAAGKSCGIGNYYCACGGSCTGTYESSNGYNTIDNCVDGSAQSAWEFVEELVAENMNGTTDVPRRAYHGGDTIEVFAQFWCYPGDRVAVAYSNNSDGVSTVWTNVYDDVCPTGIYDYVDFTFNHTLYDGEGFHALRAIIAYPGSVGMTCGQADSYSDTDDIEFYVNARPDTFPPDFTLISPTDAQSYEFTAGLEVDLIVNATDDSGVKNVSAYIVWSDGNISVNLTNITLEQYNVTLPNLVNITRYNVTYSYSDNLNNTGSTTTYFYLVNNANINLTSPVLEQTYPYNNVSLTFTINDSNSPYQEVYYYLNGNGFNISSVLSAVNNASESVDLYESNFGQELQQSFFVSNKMFFDSVLIHARINYTAEVFNGSIQILDDNVGDPGNLIYNISFNSSIFNDSSFEWVNITFNDTYNLSYGMYWLQMSSSNDVNKSFLWEMNDDNYSDGEYYNDDVYDLLFNISDIEEKYSLVMSSAEGTNSLEVCEINSLSQTECTISTFFVDTIPPTASVPTETDDPFELGSNSGWQILGVSVSDATSSVDSVLFEYNGTLYSTDSLGGNAYQYRWGVNETGTFNYRFIFNDSVNNTNNTVIYNFTVEDTTPPVASNLFYVPNSTGELDPNVSITVNVTITDLSNISNVSLEYKAVNESVWNNVVMTNVSSVYSANFTPSFEHNWTIRIYVEDVYNNSARVNETNISTFYDRTWNIIPSEFAEVFTTQGTTIEVGNITINNTGDSSLDYTISKASGIPLVSINETSVTVASGQIKTINISVQAPAQNPLPYPYSLLVECTTSSCERDNATVTGNIAVGEGGAYITFDDIIYSASVVQGQRGILLNSTIKNIGNETALNTTINWTLPTGWETLDNLSNYVGNITPYSTTFQTESYGLRVDVPIETEAGTYNLTITSYYTTADNASRSREEIKSVEVSEADTGQTVTPTPTPSGGGGGGGGGGATGGGGGGGIIPSLDYNLSIDYLDRIEIQRGKNKTLRINLTNIEEVYFVNVSLSVDGFPATRYNIAPEMINVISINESAYLDVLFDVPIYMGYSINQITLTFSGIITRNINRSGNDYSQISYLTLIVSEVDQNESLGFLMSAEQLVQEMEDANFSVDVIKKKLTDAKRAFSELDYTKVKDLFEEIKELNTVAFDVKDSFDKLSEKISEATADGYEMSNIVRLMDVVQDLFSRGDFLEAQTEVQRTEELFTIQIKTEDAQIGRIISKFVRDYWWAVLIMCLFSLIIAAVIYKKREIIRINRKLDYLKEEEEIISKTIKDLQKEHFVDKTISSKIYVRRMNKYKKRFAEIEQERIDLQNTEVKFFKTGVSHEELPVQKEELLALMKELQNKYYVDNIIDKNTYDRSFKLYKIKLAKINKKIALSEDDEGASEKGDADEKGGKKDMNLPKNDKKNKSHKK